MAGTQVYEDRRAESVKIMDDTSSKRVKIDELLEYIETRLHELDEEKEELKEYHDQDRERRCLEYGIHSRQLEEANDCLEQLENDRRQEADNSTERRELFEERERQIVQLEADLNHLRESLEALTVEKSQIEVERRDNIKSKAQVECVLKDSEDTQGKDQKTRSKLEKELAQLKADTQIKENELKVVRPQAEAKATEAHACTERLTQLKNTVESLYAKQGRASQFRTQKERDAHLKSEISKLRAVLRSAEEMIESLSNDLGATKQSLDEVQVRGREIRSKLDQRKHRLQQLTLELGKDQDEHSDLSEKRKALWKDDTKVSNSMQHAATMRDKAQKDLNMTMDRVSV